MAPAPAAPPPRWTQPQPAFRPEAIVSTGFCGALDRALDVAEVVVATAWWPRTAAHGAQRRLAARPRTHRGVVCSIDHVAQTAAEESAPARRRSVRRGNGGRWRGRACRKLAGLPFYCIRAVTDLAGENMANDFNAALRSDGHFDTIGNS